jgi:septal ring factor EnvC (AmiA/AmiB activator)
MKTPSTLQKLTNFLSGNKKNIDTMDIKAQQKLLKAENDRLTAELAKFADFETNLKAEGDAIQTLKADVDSKTTTITALEKEIADLKASLETSKESLKTSQEKETSSVQKAVETAASIGIAPLKVSIENNDAESIRAHYETIKGTTAGLKYFRANEKVLAFKKSEPFPIKPTNK